MNEDVTLTYDIFEQKNVSFKTMKIYSIQNTQPNVLNEILKILDMKTLKLNLMEIKCKTRFF